MINVNKVKDGKEVRPLVVGDKVKVQVNKYKNFRGIVAKITDSYLVIHVPTYYGSGEPYVKEFSINQNGIVEDIEFVNEKPVL